MIYNQFLKPVWRVEANSAERIEDKKQRNYPDAPN